MFLIVLVVLLALIGWCLGIVAFFRSKQTLERVAVLELLLEAGRSGASATVPTPAREAEVPVFADNLTPEPLTPDPRVETFASKVAAVPTAVDETKAGSFEERLTTRFGVWLGAVALLLAGVFLVRYAVEAGLLGPVVRCSLAGLLGFALLGGGFVVARRRPGKDDYVPAALAAGGVATLLAAAYGAGPLYLLLPAPIDFVLMALAGAIGLAASLQLGWLVAAVGLAGAYTTPLLAIQPTDPSVPGLFGYLAVVTAAALAVVRYTAWTWLGWAATMAAAFYAMAQLVPLSAANVWAVAAFDPVVACLALFLLPPAAIEDPVGRRLAWSNFAVLGLAGLTLCAAVDDWTCKAGVLLLAPLAVARAASQPRLDRLPWLAGGYFLLLLLIWAVPVSRTTGEVLATDTWSVVLPGDWAPQVIRPLLMTAGGMAGFFALCGLWVERRAERPVVWAALPAAVPVLALGVTYAQIRLFETNATWAAVALLLAVGLVAAARRAVGPQAAGIYAAGAVAALALGCAMLLREQWLTIAYALFLPPLAWIEVRSELRALRQVALVVALLVLGRLLLNWFVLEYAFGHWPVVNTLLSAYGVPATAFAVAAWMFRRRGEDLTTGVLEAGAVAFTTVLVVAEIHHWAIGDRLRAWPVSFLEFGLEVSALGALALAVLRMSVRVGGPVFDAAWKMIGSGAACGAVGLLMFNPGLTDTYVGRWAVLDSLIPAYAVPAGIALLVAWRVGVRGPLGSVLVFYAILAVLTWISLELRHVFHPTDMGLDRSGFAAAELWGYSGIWLIYGALLLGIGLVGATRRCRVAGLAVIGLVALKVFLVDMAGLEGLWRVLSFLGLGLALLALGAFYRRFVVIAPNAPG